MALGIKVGDTYSFSKKVSNEDVFSFAEVSGDKNPLHLDDEYAKNTMFKGRIAHGMIGAGIISAAIGMGMPGVGTTYLSQDLKFKKAVRIDDTLTVELEVTETEPGIQGDTSKAGNKPATLETGYNIQVPLFVNTGDKIRVDTRTGTYMERVK